MVLFVSFFLNYLGGVNTYLTAVVHVVRLYWLLEPNGRAPVPLSVFVCACRIDIYTQQCGTQPRATPYSI